MLDPMLARDYDVPKKSLFILEGQDIVQNRDAAAYISNSVTDSVMHGTNGNLGLRHNSELETVGFKTSVMLTGVYHSTPRDQVIRCSALPQEVHTGAEICLLDLNCRIDGESGTLSSIPSRRMNLEDGAYRSACEDVMSSDGRVRFDCNYIRTVSATDLSLWGARVCYNNFRIDSEPSTGSDYAGGDEATTAWTGVNNYSRLNPSFDSDGEPRGPPSAPPFGAGSWRVEFVATYCVSLAQWEVLKANQMDEIWQRSLSSGVIVSSSTEVQCTVNYASPSSNASPATSSNMGSNDGTANNRAASFTTRQSSSSMPPNASQGGSCSMNAEVEMVTSTEGSDSIGLPMSSERYNSNPMLAKEKDYTSDDGVGRNSSSAGLGGMGGMNGSSQAGSMMGSSGIGSLGAVFGGRGANMRANSFTASPGAAPARNDRRCFLIRKRYVYTLTQDNVPTSFVFTFKARHVQGNTTIKRPFPKLRTIIAERKKSLDEFWAMHPLDLQLQEELIPGRTRLALLYTAFRLFGVSYSLRNGLPRAGGSCAGDALQCDLREYYIYSNYYMQSCPSGALALLMSLYDMLPQARKNARMLSLAQGAVFPECTITGLNCKYYTNISTPRYHINAEIGSDIYRYFIFAESVEKEARLKLLELMLETARIWLQLGEWRENTTSFHLDNLAGSDEYNTSGCGNFYVHLCAMRHMTTALELLSEQERIIGAAEVSALMEKLNIPAEELATMAAASKAIVLPRNEQVGAYMVHDTFDSLTPWASNERAKHPLLLNYHPLAIFRQKIVDVPEVLQGMVIHEEMFGRHDFERNLTYYAPLCTFDRPESLMLFALSLCRARQNFAQPIPYIRSLLHLDLDNIMYLAEDGLHMGAMAAGMTALINGMGGVTIHARSLHIDPLLPAGVTSYCFSVCWRGAVLKVTLNSEVLTYELIAGDNIRFIHGPNKNRIHLHTGFQRCVAMKRMQIPRNHFSQIGQFDGAVFSAECMFDDFLEYSYVAWVRTLESLFDNYRSLHQRNIPSLTPEEYVEKVVYQTEEQEIAFSGIHSVLLDRGINLDLGSPDDAEIVETRYGLANATMAEVAELVAQRQPQMNMQLMNIVHGLANNGVTLAIVSYSRSLKQLLAHYTELTNYFVTRIDGEEAHDRKIKGRPHLDLFAKAADKIHVHPSRCIVVSNHLDRGYNAESLATFRVFLDIDDPFVSSRVTPRAYPQLDEEAVARLGRDNPVVCRVMPDRIPHTIDELEDVIEGREIKDKLAPGSSLPQHGRS